MHEHQLAAPEPEGDLTCGLAEDRARGHPASVQRGWFWIRRVVGLGLGTATLVRAFPDVTVVAVRNLPSMMQRTAGRAAALGRADRVEARLLDIDRDLRSLGALRPG